MQLVYQGQDALVACTVVCPEDAPEVVPSPLLLPQSLEELFVRYGEFPLEVLLHGCEDSFITCTLIICLHGPEHRHLGPEVRTVAVIPVGAKHSVGALIAEYSSDPSVSLVLHGVVAQDVCKADVASNPIGYFFPSVVTSIGEPLVVVLVQPSADGAQLAVESVLLKFQILAKPSFWLYFAYRQFRQWYLLERCSEGDVVGVGDIVRWSFYHVNHSLCRCVGGEAEAEYQERCEMSFHIMWGVDALLYIYILWYNHFFSIDDVYSSRERTAINLFAVDGVGGVRALWGTVGLVYAYRLIVLHGQTAV